MGAVSDDLEKVLLCDDRAIVATVGSRRKGWLDWSRVSDYLSGNSGVGVERELTGVNRGVQRAASSHHII